jgi:hypothetical protein
MHSSYYNIKAYFEALCEKSNFLKGFAGFFERELKTKLHAYNSLQGPYLALFKYEMALEGPELNTQAVRHLGFAIMFNDVPADDYEAQYHAINKAESLALKVLARMSYDNNLKTHWLYNALLKDSIEINPVELSANEFGVEVQLSIKNPQALKIEKCDWKDIQTACPK